MAELVELLGAALAAYLTAFWFAVYMLFDVLPRWTDRWTPWRGEPDIWVSIRVDIRREILEAGALHASSELAEEVADYIAKRGKEIMERLEADLSRIQREHGHSNGHAGENSDPGG